MLAARERTGWGPRLIAGELGLSHSTVHAILRRHGCSRPARAPRERFRRYEWPCPGDLLHMDVKRYPRFRRPGHAIIGDRRASLQHGKGRLKTRRQLSERQLGSRVPGEDCEHTWLEHWFIEGHRANEIGALQSCQCSGLSA